jgi:osmotically-inducible protein OsmY
MHIDHQKDFIVRGKYAFRNNETDPRIRHNDFQFQRMHGSRQESNPNSRYQFSQAEFYNSIQREGRAYDLAANYRRHDDVAGQRRKGDEGSWQRKPQALQSKYRRSSDVIEDEIHVRLTEHPDLDATEIRVDLKDAEVILSGFVDSRMSKRLAEDICESVRGVQHVENRLRVQPPLGNGVSIGG